MQSISHAEYKNIHMQILRELRALVRRREQKNESAIRIYCWRPLMNNIFVFYSKLFMSTYKHFYEITLSHIVSHQPSVGKQSIYITHTLFSWPQSIHFRKWLFIFFLLLLE